MRITTATRNKLLVKSGFSGYDLCLNTYVGCQFGCKYCYVRFFIKDDDAEWGEWVRVREHVLDKLPKELAKTEGQRLVIGTMTDAYQPIERKYRITRTALQTIVKSPYRLKKVGIFTRSPIITDDIKLIKCLPKARVHYTITPYSRDILMRLEPIPILTERRFEVVAQLKAAGIRTHVNVAPALPFLSEEWTTSFAQRLSQLAVDEFFVDPMQAYAASFAATFGALADLGIWAELSETIQNKDKYLAWKEIYREQWFEAWRQVDNGTTLPIWSDHEHKTWVNMRTGEPMSRHTYGDEITPVTE